MRKDITGQRFERLVAVSPTDKRKNQSIIWKCVCDCGNVVEVPIAHLCSGHTKSCGCLQRERAAQVAKKRAKDLTGQRFGQLVAIRPIDKRLKSSTSVMWECKCDCGKLTEVLSDNLLRGFTKSCGCYQRKSAAQRAKNRIKDITGQRFGRLVAIRPIDKRLKSSSSMMWECKCDCGNKIEVTLVYLQSVTSDVEKSCGCSTYERRVDLGKNIDVKKLFGFVENTQISKLKSDKPNKNSKTGHRGVYYNSRLRKYIAQIGFKNVRYNLGMFNTLEEAIEARRKAEGDLYKPFLESHEENCENNEY